MLPDTLLLDHLPVNIGWKDHHFQYVGANKQLLSLKGLKYSEDIIGKSDYDLSPESTTDNQLFYEQDSHVLNGGQISTIHYDAAHQTFNFLEKAPIKDENNQILGIIYYCKPLEKSEIFTLLRELDHKLHLNVQNYTLDFHQNVFQLTERECECVFLLIRCKTAKEIASILSLSRRTVESYIENIKNKMNCHNKAEVIVKALENHYQNQIPARFKQGVILNNL